MNEQQVRDIATEVYQNLSVQSQFNVAAIPAHVHNGTDTNRIPPTSVIGFVPLSANNTGAVPDPNAGVISTDNISAFVNVAPTIIYPTTVIGGFSPGNYSVFNGGNAPTGTLVAFYSPTTLGTVAQLWIAMQATQLGVEFNFTGAVSGGATSATLTVLWIYNTGIYTVKFSNGDVRQVTFTNQATTATWSGGLSSNATNIFNANIFTQWFGVDLILNP